MSKWLTILGIGEDGVPGLSPVGRSLLDQAEILVGGDRHLAMIPPEVAQERLLWTSPIATSVAEILQRRGQAVCVLASGDPLCYGIGVTLLRQIPISEMTIIPAVSAFSLACARMGWSLSETETLSLCGRDLALVNAVIYPGAQLLILSADRQTPALVAQLLTQQGYGASSVTVLERMGGLQERRTEGMACSWSRTDLADLNTLAITCRSTLAESTGLTTAQAATLPKPRLPGLPDAAYQHDGQLTKREVRAITLSTLAPLPGQLLWDVGAGCGSISIEWMRTHPRCRAIALEQHPKRLQYIADNATALGTPELKIIAGVAPTTLQNLPQPDAIFIGGGLTTPDLLATCWQALRSGGRLAANAVTVESEQQLFQWRSQLGGNLSRIAIQRAEPIGQFLGWKAMAPVTQWMVQKP
jgi:precorrin-6B C5,15-methyltransferase / cobalt-precorrin-6B C5,C15-methyltransferase